jgi:hypothetical protein
MALAAASSSGRKDVIAEEFTSQSLFFKKFCSSQMARARTTRSTNGINGNGFLFSDDDIVKQITIAVPAARRKLIAGRSPYSPTNDWSHSNCVGAYTCSLYAIWSHGRIRSITNNIK